MNQRLRRLIIVSAAGVGVVWIAAPQAGESPIHFSHRKVDFVLDSCETAEKHAPETMAGGVAVFDYDRDGDLDIFFANGADIRTLKKTAAKYRNRLFQNDGKGNFTDVTDRAKLAGVGYDNGVAVGDYDNDGYPDLFVGGVHSVTLYHNERDGTFADVTVRAGLNKPDAEYGPLWSVGGAWLDADNDGKLDLFVLNYLAWDLKSEPPCEYRGRREYCHPRMYKKTPNQLFLNNGDGTFRDASAESGVRAHAGKGMGVAVADYDLNGTPDLFVTNDKLYNFFFRGLGGGKFEEIGFDANVQLRETGEFISGMGADFRDLDNDGFPDILYVALDNETFPVFRNNGKGLFLDVTRDAGMAQLSMSMAGYSPNIADFDNDGLKDLFVSRGHVQSLEAAPRITVAQHNSVFRNLGKWRFAALTAEAGLTSAAPARHRGSAAGDLNGDGRLDVVVSGIGVPAGIWLNDSAGAGHWIAIALEGVRSNRSGAGARIKVISKSGTQYDHFSTAGGYASSSAGPVHFGLGAERTAGLIEIRWPSGIVQTLRDVEGDRVVTVREAAK